jgi:nitrate/nitrite-specific signal transduction histidine kinase
VTCRVRPPIAQLVVEDDGSRVRQAGRGEGFGISIMRERAARVGASLTITERADGGTRVSVDLESPDPTDTLLSNPPAPTSPSLVPVGWTPKAVARG